MSAVASLQTELRNLIAQSRKRNSELSASSEASLARLDALERQRLSESEIWPQLRADPKFVTPFILACSAANAKACASALQCVQALATYHGIAPSELHSLLEALLEATQLGLGIQLKILQLLPVLLYEYGSELRGPLAVELLQVCAELLSSNKVATVHNTAYATLQQLITGLFDRIPAREVEKNADRELIVSQDVSFRVGPYVYDAAMVLLDLCDLVEGGQPQFLHFQPNDLPLSFTLELLELTLTNQAQIMHQYQEFGTILRLRITPLLLRLFSEMAEFPIALRVIRIFYLLLRSHLDVVPTESEVVLANLTQCAATGATWKRALCLEVLQGICLEPDLVLEIWTRYDGHKDRMDVLQSAVGGFADAVGNHHLEGGLTRASALRMPVIDMLDKSEPPRVPPEYLYYLIVKSVGSLADGLHKLAQRSRTRPETTHTISTMVDALGTPLLKCFTILLGATADMELYRLVVRAVQRTAHAAGVLGAPGLRDDAATLLQQFIYMPSEDAEMAAQLFPRVTLCCRALFSLGHALGNQLGPSWTIVADVVDRLAQMVDGNPTLTNFLGSRSEDGVDDADDMWRPIEASLRKLIDATPDLNDEAVVALMRALGSRPVAISFVLLQYIAQVNIGRFADPEGECWPALVELLLKWILEDTNGGDTVNGTRRTASTVLNNVALAAMEEAANEVEEEEPHPDNISDNDPRAQMQRQIVEAACRQMEARDYEIQVAMVGNLNRLLDKFGARLLSGWDLIFDVLSQVGDSSQELDANLVRAAFHTLELVCSDFLDNLPFACVFSLTLCLDKFARQTMDINASFTSTSLFWAVCDHLMRGAQPAEFPSNVDDEETLVRLARDDKSPNKRYALWMLAQIRLASLARVPQHQVRTGAIQIFLRLFDAHGSKLPLGAWAAAHQLAFRTLTEARPAYISSSIEESRGERDETTCLVVQGLGRIWVANVLRRFSKLPKFTEYWQVFVDSLDAATQSPAIAFAAYTTIKEVIKASQCETESSTKPMVPIVAKFWMNQSASPSYGSSAPKATADALAAYVGLLPSISSSFDSFEARKALGKIAEATVFPYYHSGGSRSTEPSSLQLVCVRQLESFHIDSNSALLGDYLTTLAAFSMLPFEDGDDDAADDSTVAPTLGPDMFRGLGRWSLDKLSSLLAGHQEILSRAPVADHLPGMLETLLRIIPVAPYRELAVRTYLQLLEACSGLNVREDSIVSGASAILGGGADDEDADMAAMDQYMRLVESWPQLPGSEWDRILEHILVNSTVYERHRLTRHYWESGEYARDDQSDLGFGSIEPPRVLPRRKVAYYCLAQLQRLAVSRGGSAKQLYDARTLTVLRQYAGDALLLGMEPLRSVLREELLVILEQLLELQIERESRAPAQVSDLLVQCLPHSDPEVQSLAARILRA